MFNLLEELWDEVTDFFEDFAEMLGGKAKAGFKARDTVINGVEVKVRPAYIFAERIDNFLKLIFGLSIAISAFTASFLGFASLGDLVDLLIKSYWGRGLMLIVGSSYVIISLWKLLHLKTTKSGK